MDKGQILEAYRRGLLTLQECARLLGLSPDRARELFDKPREERTVP